MDADVSMYRKLWTHKIIQILAAVIILLSLVRLFQTLYAAAITDEKNDLASYYESGQWIRQGLSPYRDFSDLPNDPRPYIYPPILAYLFMLFNNYGLAVWIWGLLSIFFWGLSIFLIIKQLWIPILQRVKTTTWIWLLVAALMIFPPLIAHLAWGQTQLLLLFLLTLSWLQLRNDHEVRAGLLMGLATAIKLYPAIVLAPLILNRKWKTLLAGGLSASSLVLFSFLPIGLEQIVTFLHTVKFTNQLFAYKTQSITTSFVLLFGDTQLADILTWFIRFTVVGFTIWTVYRCHPYAERIFVLGVTLVLLISPFVWLHYFVLLTLPWLESLAHATPRQLALLVLVYLLLAIAPSIFILKESIAMYVHILPNIGILLLFGIQIAQLRKNSEIQAVFASKI